jgi:hypothetical protein
LVLSLLESGKDWEAHKITRLFLDVYKPDEDRVLFKEFGSRPRQDDEEEGQIIARLSFTKLI